MRQIRTASDAFCDSEISLSDVYCKSRRKCSATSRRECMFILYDYSICLGCDVWLMIAIFDPDQRAVHALQPVNEDNRTLCNIMI